MEGVSMNKVLRRHIIELVESHDLGKTRKPGKITASWFPFWATLARWHHDFMSLNFKNVERLLSSHWICQTCMIFLDLRL